MLEIYHDGFRRCMSTRMLSCCTHCFAKWSVVKRWLEARARSRIDVVSEGDSERASANRAAYSSSVLAWKPNVTE